MLRRIQFGSFGVAVIALSFVVSAPPAVGQGLRNVIHSGTRVFPGVGPGVAALKRDSSGRYYVLAEPADRILVYDAAGKPAGQIPNANSRGATIRYAVDIDLDSRDRLFVADRGTNAVKVFAPDGSLVASVPVVAPTSIVALSDDQFAVTTLRSSRLVQIMSEKGATIRSFGDPADQPGQGSAAQQVVDRGRIVGDQAGNIYFSFTTLPDPTLQKYDRFGYSAYEAAIPADRFGPSGRGASPVQFGVTMSALGWPTGVSAWTDLHSLSSLSLAGGMRRGQRGQAAAPAASGPGQVEMQGNALDFTADSDLDSLENLGAGFDATNMTALGDFGQGFMPPGAFGMGMPGGFHDRMPGMSSEMRARPPGAEDGMERWHGHPGSLDFYRASGTVRVTLDNPASTTEKPVISAVGVDPATQEAWAAIGDTLVHFDKNGNAIDMYYLALTDGLSLKPAAVLVEPDRFLIAADPWGIYEFPRPDKAPPSETPQLNVVPQQIPPANEPPSQR